jgi:hypothetical protein
MVTSSRLSLTKRAFGACDHRLGALHLAISARRRRFYIDNHRVLHIDQVGGGVAWLAVRSRC